MLDSRTLVVFAATKLGSFRAKGLYGYKSRRGQGPLG